MVVIDDLERRVAAVNGTDDSVVWPKTCIAVVVPRGNEKNSLYQTSGMESGTVLRMRSYQQYADHEI